MKECRIPSMIRHLEWGLRSLKLPSCSRRWSSASSRSKRCKTQRSWGLQTAKSQSRASKGGESEPRRPAEYRFAWQQHPATEIRWCDLCGASALPCVSHRHPTFLWSDVLPSQPEARLFHMVCLFGLSRSICLVLMHWFVHHIRW